MKTFIHCLRDYRDKTISIKLMDDGYTSSNFISGTLKEIGDDFISLEVEVRKDSGGTSRIIFCIKIDCIRLFYDTSTL